jgi:hypothetical protein
LLSSYTLDNYAGRAFDQVLCVFQTQAGLLTHGFNDLDFVGTDDPKPDIERRFLELPSHMSLFRGTG